MTSTSDSVVRAYRMDRARVAALGASPSLLYVGAAALAGADRTAFVLGALQFAAAALFVFVGRPFSRGVGLGYLFGLVPFITASVAQSAGHVCLDGACMSVCAPACTAAGLVTGVLASVATVKVRGGFRSFAATATSVLLAGAMGCHCVGYGSVLGLATGMLLASIPAWPRLVADTRAA